MKLRQKLAVVLASAMTFSALPVITMADSSNKIIKASEVVKKDTKTTSGAIKIKFEDYDDTEEFYLTLTNAKWLQFDEDDLPSDIEEGNIVDEGSVLPTADEDCDTAYLVGQDNLDTVSQIQYLGEKAWKYTFENGATAEYYKQSDSVVRVVFDKGSMNNVTTEYVEFPLPVKLTGGSASVALTGEGSDSTITEGSFVFASTGEKGASLTVGDLNAFYDDGELSKLTLKETYVGSLTSNDLLIKIALQDTDFEFKNSTVTLKGTYGFNKTLNTKDNESVVKFTIDEDDPSTAYVWISAGAFAGDRGGSLGRVEITGIKLDADEDDLEQGNLLADITSISTLKASENTKQYNFTDNGDNALGKCEAELDQDYDDTAVAKIANYGAYIKMKDEKAVDIVAGRDEEVVFEVIESVDDVFVGSRTITIDLEDNTTDDKDYKDSYFWIENTQSVIDDLIDDDPREIVESVEIVWHDDKAPKAGESGKADAIKVTLKDEDKDGKEINTNDEIDKFKVKAMLYVPVGQMDKKEIKLIADMRGVDEFKEATAANVIKPFDITFDTTTLKVGLQDQAMNALTIKETDKAMFMKGELVFDIVEGSKDQSGITIEDEGDLTVEGELKRTDLDTNDKDQDTVTIKRQSKSASTLKIDGMEVTVDRTVPEGSYDLKISGTAVDEHGGDIKFDDVIAIGTPNTQDITSAGLTKGTVTFVISESKYTVNGIETAMDAPSYIQAPGYTMVPVRYVAKAFGVAEKDIIFGKGTVTLFAGERTISLTNGSNQAVVNGNPIAMGTAVVIRDGRTYAPAGEIARLLGIATSWDAATKTATFTN